MDTQPKIPTLKDSQKPQVKVRGLEAGVTLFDRLKQFKKKDLAFILAGLGTLFMAPLAEHFMMSPETGDGTLQQGWKGGAGGKGGGMFDGSGSSPYEPGVSGLAPGSAVGGGSDIITPLNVRDPSALVMGPGATQQPPTNSVMPSTPPPTAVATHSDSDLKDALAASARGVGAGLKAAKTLLPIPKIALAGQGGLRGLGVVSGGSSATASPISSAGLVTGKAAQGNNLGGVTGAKGVTGVARGQTAGGGTSAMDALKAAGDKAAGAFNRSGAADALNAAAGTAIPTGGGANGGAGSGGNGVTDKPDSGNSSKDGKTVGESLAFLKQKAMQEAQIALWAKEQEAGDTKLEGLKIRNTMAESIAGSVATAVGGQIGCLIVPSGSTCVNTPGGVTSYSCNLPGAAAGTAPLPPISASIVGTTPQSCQTTAAAPNGAGGVGGAAQVNGKVYYYDGNGNMDTCTSNGPGPLYAYCTPNGAAAPGPKAGPKDMGSTSGFAGMSGQPMTGLKDACTALTALQTNLQATKADPTDKTGKATISIISQSGAVQATEAKIATFLGQGVVLVGVRDAIGTPAATGGAPATGATISPTNDCGAASGLLSGHAPVSVQLTAIAGSNGSLLTPGSGLVAGMTSAVTATDPAAGLTALTATVPGVTTAITAFATDVKALDTAIANVPQTSVSDPLGIAACKAAVGSNWSDTFASAATAGATTIQTAAGTAHTAVNNLDQAASTLNGLITSQNSGVPPLLSGSFDSNGNKGTLTQIVTTNKAYNAAVNPTPALPSPPLTVPDLTKAVDKEPTGTGAINSVTSDIQTASGHMDGTVALTPATKGLTADLTAFTTAQAAKPDANCSTQPCKDSNTDLTQVAADIRHYQADQTAVNTAISQAATTAGALAGPGAPAVK